jgi:hypothetical protein
MRPVNYAGAERNSHIRSGLSLDSCCNQAFAPTEKLSGLETGPRFLHATEPKEKLVNLTSVPTFPLRALLDDGSELDAGIVRS